MNPAADAVLKFMQGPEATSSEQGLSVQEVRWLTAHEWLASELRVQVHVGACEEEAHASSTAWGAACASAWPTGLRASFQELSSCGGVALKILEGWSH